MSLSSRRISAPFNPMAAVDVAALEAQMKKSALDGLRGYSQDHFAVVKQTKGTEYVPKDKAAGYQMLREPAWNKGS
jgi:malate dehydrogenase (oxaloacetate-decarboxylating)(NADP+)